jgi:5-(carboxyamino)imidazole ribonucleotide mutase
LPEVSNPCVILFSDGPAARLLLRNSEALLAEFPGIRVRNVNNSAAADKKGAVGPATGAGVDRWRGPFIGIYATSEAGSIAELLARVEPNPLIVVPMAQDSESGLALLKEAAAAGAPTVALGEAGARNAALLALSLFASRGPVKLRKALDGFRARQTSTVRKMRLPAV